MAGLYCTKDVSPGERVAFWRDLMAENIAPRELYSASTGDFSARMQSAELGAVHLVDQTASGYETHRTPRLIRRSDPEALIVTSVLSGTVQVAQDGRETELSHGVVLCDTTRPFRTRGGISPSGAPFRIVNLCFPTKLLPIPEKDLRDLTARPLSADSGPAALTAQFIGQLADHIGACTPADALRLSTTVLDLVAASVAHRTEQVSLVPPDSHRRVLIEQIHGFIHERLADPELSPAVIAAAHHISVRYLHKLFEEQAAGPAQLIRELRLDRCRGDLADPARRTVPVGMIAARWGFSSAPYFSRAFKAAYGMTPQEFRHTTMMRRPASQ